jgi:membrane protease YdiL (CAAX protease family)
MKNDLLPAGERWERIVLAGLFITVGALIYLVFSPLRPLLEPVPDYLGRLALIGLLLVGVWWVRRNPRFEKYQPIWLGLLIMAVAVSVDRVFSIYLLVYLGVSDTTAAGWAIPKLNECAIVFCVVILLTRLSGGSLGSIYLQRGNLRLGLTLGLITFGLAAAGSTLMANFLFKGRDLTLERISLWLPWLLIFVLANAAQEELLFRGLFLRKLEPFFGRVFSNLMIVFVFTALHKGADYMSSEGIFLAALIPLALAWGYLTQKTEGLWGAILFHAGMDLPILLGIFSNLT